MSIAAISWALRQSIARSSEKFVLVCMCNYADENGFCYPSIAALSSDTSQDRKTVITAIASLESAGFVADTGDRVGRTGQIKIYRINSPENGTAKDAQNRNGSENGTVPIFRGNSTVFPSKEYRKRYTEPSGNHQGTVTGDEQLTLHDSLPRESWDEWIAHRREKRWSMSPRALKPQLKLLAKYDTETQREMIETSMQAGWQGVFAPKGKPKPKDGQQWM